MNLFHYWLPNSETAPPLQELIAEITSIAFNYSEIIVYNITL